MIVQLREHSRAWIAINRYYKFYLKKRYNSTNINAVMLHYNKELFILSSRTLFKYSRATIIY